MEQVRANAATQLIESLRGSLRLHVAVAVVTLSIIGGVAAAWHPREAILAIGLVAFFIVLAYFRSFLLSGVLFCGLVVIFRDDQAGGISAMGVLTIYLALGSWVLLIAQRAWSRWLLLTMSPWIVLVFWAAATLLWSPTQTAGFQNVSVLAAFVGMVLLSAERSRASEAFQHSVLNVVMITTGIVSGIYSLSLITGGIGAEFMGIGARGYALLALVGIACYLAVWRYGSKLGLLATGATTSLVILSLSRTAFVASLILVPLSRLKPKSVSGWVYFLIWAGLGVAALQLLITRVDAIRTRFVEGDLGLEVGGFAVNVMGRTAFWEETIRSFWGSPWFGHGAGTSQVLVAEIFGVSHPHNDYLRYLHDFGIFGFSIFVLGLVVLIWIIFRQWIRADTSRTADAPTHLAAFLGLIAAAMVMLTDNVIVYIFVIGPLAALVGASLGRASLYHEDDTSSKPRGSAQAGRVGPAPQAVPASSSGPGA